MPLTAAPAFIQHRISTFSFVLFASSPLTLHSLRKYSYAYESNVTWPSGSQSGSLTLCIILKGYIKRVEPATTVLMVLVRSANPLSLIYILSFTGLAVKGSTAYFVTFPAALEVQGYKGKMARCTSAFPYLRR